MGLAHLNVLAEKLALDALDVDTQTERIPTNATSEFLANRAMGDWAETRLQEVVNAAGFFATGYGEDNSMAAGDDGFDEMYLANRQVQRLYGKKPDILVYDRTTAKRLGLGVDLRQLTIEQQNVVVPQALVGIEVRSSKFRAAKYHEVRAAQIAAGEDVQEFQSFTPKVEDLPVILKWVRTFKVPHVYAQVFLDEMYAIPFERILRILAAREATNFRLRASLPVAVDGFPVQQLRTVEVQKPKNSNFKKTHMIPVSFGQKIARISGWDAGVKPEFEKEISETRLGRINAYVRPVGGQFNLADGALRTLVDGLAKDR